MNNLESLAGKAIGFGHAHIEDDLIHTNLVQTLGAQNAPRLVMEPLRLNGNVRRGDLSLGALAAAWVLKNDIDVLVVPALDDHHDHRAAALIARLASRELLSIGYNLGILEPDLSRTPTKPAISQATQEGRSASQPLVPSDFMDRPELVHTAWTGAYRLVPAANLAVDRLALATPSQ